MTSPRGEAELPAQVADDLRRVIGLLADACWEAEESRLSGRRAPGRRGLGNVVKPVSPVAVALIRNLAEGNPRKVRALLSVRRTQAEWRRLVLMLASAADLERLVVPGSVKPDRKAA